MNKLEFKIERLDNADVISTSCNGFDLTHVYVTKVKCNDKKHSGDTYYKAYGYHHVLEENVWSEIPETALIKFGVKGKTGWVHLDSDTGEWVECNHAKPKDMPSDCCQKDA